MRVTNHVRLRIAERNVTTKHLVDCLKHGKYVAHKTDPQRKVILGREIIMVTNEDYSVLITVFPTKGRKSL